MGYSHPSGIAVTQHRILDVLSVTTDATADAVTFTPAALLGGLILRDPAGGDRADKVPTAAALAAAMGDGAYGGTLAGQAFEFTIRNTADAAETITLTTNTGMTMSGTMTIAQGNSKRFIVIMASATAATVYSLGTVTT